MPGRATFFALKLLKMTQLSYCNAIINLFLKLLKMVVGIYKFIKLTKGKLEEYPYALLIL